MADLKQMVTCDRSGHDDDMGRMRGDAEERLGMGETPEVEGDTREHSANWPLMCGMRTVLFAVEAFGVLRDFLTLGKAEEATVKENLLQRAPRMFTRARKGMNRAYGDTDEGGDHS